MKQKKINLMLGGNPKKLSWLISVSIHVIFAIVLFFITISAESNTEEFVTIGFGTYGTISKPGVKNVKKNREKSGPKTEKAKKKPKPKLKKVELPKANPGNIKNTIRQQNNKSKSDSEVLSQAKKKKKQKKGDEAVGDDEGNSGFKIDFGGKGIRKIYSYTLPKYPSGVSKEVDIKLKFTILPDGTVGKVFPLIKADANLESASIISLRQWRFEPLPESMKQIEQKAVIVFPYRLQ